MQQKKAIAYFSPMRLLNSTKICNVFLSKMNKEEGLFHLFYDNLENVNGSRQVVFN